MKRKVTAAITLRTFEMIQDLFERYHALICEAQGGRIRNGLPFVISAVSFRYQCR
jgi:hypothetical protein